MEATKLTREDALRAQQIWAEYQNQHDVSARKGQAVGIDPFTGRLWFGDSALEIVDQLKAEGLQRPLLFLRVGQGYYWRKGSRR